MSAARRRALNLIDSAAEVYAIAKHYEDVGDPELMRRVKVRIARVGLTVEQVEARCRQRAEALAAEQERA